jgi:NAD(P)-dependent dehydrogenase (short-subunit alcohol dehydrogenase family)
VRGRRAGPFDNAGIAGPTAPVASYPADAWHQVIAVNLIGAAFDLSGGRAVY